MYVQRYMAHFPAAGEVVIYVGEHRATALLRQRGVSLGRGEPHRPGIDLTLDERWAFAVMSWA